MNKYKDVIGIPIGEVLNLSINIIILLNKKDQLEKMPFLMVIKILFIIFLVMKI